MLLQVMIVVNSGAREGGRARYVSSKKFASTDVV
jgi:hypothetical protein